jgi:hypothetical protein
VKHLPKINHNNTDYKSFQELMQQRIKLLDMKEKEHQSEIRQNNLEKWLQSVPEEYKNANVRLFKKSLFEGILPYIKQQKLPYRTLIFGAMGSGRTFLTYSLIRGYISSGILTPNEIRWAGIREGADAVMGGFAKQAWRDNFFDNNAKLFILKGTSRSFTELGVTGSDKFLGEFVQFVNEQHKSAIIIYETNSKEEKYLANGGLGGWWPYLTMKNNLIASLLTREAINIHVTSSTHVSPNYKRGDKKS